MRGTVAKRLKKQVYGDSYSYRYRKYFSNNGQIVSDDKRRLYQELKKEHYDR